MSVLKPRKTPWAGKEPSPLRNMLLGVLIVGGLAAGCAGSGTSAPLPERLLGTWRAHDITIRIQGSGSGTQVLFSAAIGETDTLHIVPVRDRNVFKATVVAVHLAYGETNSSLPESQVAPEFRVGDIFTITIQNSDLILVESKYGRDYGCGPTSFVPKGTKRSTWNSDLQLCGLSPPAS